MALSGGTALKAKVAAMMASVNLSGKLSSEHPYSHGLSAPSPMGYGSPEKGQKKATKPKPSRAAQFKRASVKRKNKARNK